MPNTVEGDRRRHPRVPVEQPCKIHDPHTGKYIAGCTRDVSIGGALIEVPKLLALNAGETLHVGVALKRRQGLIRCNEMIQAAVTRIMHTVDDRTLLGLRFQQPAADEIRSPLLAAA